MNDAVQPPDSASQDLARAIGESFHGDQGPDKARLRRLAGLASRSASSAGSKAVASGRWLAEVSLDTAGHLPVRDLATLREHHNGLAGAYLSRNLIRNASIASGAVGAATGALAAASLATPATWAAMPVELAVETLVVVGIEMKLIGELHEAAGYPIASDLRRNGPLIARAWSETRGIDARDLALLARPGQATMVAHTASELLGRGARDQLTEQIRKRLVRRAGRNTVTFVPLMAGALAGGELNRRATRRFGTQVAATLGIPPP